MSSDRQIERVFLLVDVAVLVAAMGAAFVLRGALIPLLPGLKPTVPAGEYLHILLVFVPTWAWCADRLGLYRTRTLRGPLIDLLRSLLSTQAWGALAISAILVAARVSLNRSFIGVFLVASTFFLLVDKLAQQAWIRRQRGRVTSLVVGEDPIGAEIAGELERLRGRLVERLPDPEPGALRKRLHTGSVDEVVIGGARAQTRLRSLLEVCEEIGVPALARIERVHLDLARPNAEFVGTSLYLSYRTLEPDRPSLLVKELVDRLGAAVGLIVLSPLLLLVAVLVKATSPGPVLFSQLRGGLHGRPFRMFKFRTMRSGAEAERESLLGENEMDGPVFKLSEDPRVTQLGRLLRRTSVDELPQLVNVLFGQMSLVGPRPLPVVEARELDGVHRRRMSVRPGITGLWQVSGRNDLTFQEWMALDLQYVDNWNLGLDAIILLRTIPAIFLARGAR
jgi:exopolysaccharide biosynthesis polyprenyl glycosylphosphotransferase